MLLDLDPYGGKYPDEMFPLVYKQMARELATKLAVLFRHLVTGVSFPACWGFADIVPVPEELSSTDGGACGPISISSFLSKVLEKVVAGKLSHFFGKVTDCFLLLSFVFVYEGAENMRCFAHIVSLSRNCSGQRHGGKACSVGFFASFDRASCRGRLYKLLSVGVG